MQSATSVVRSFIHSFRGQILFSNTPNVFFNICFFFCFVLSLAVAFVCCSFVFITEMVDQFSVYIFCSYFKSRWSIFHSDVYRMAHDFSNIINHCRDFECTTRYSNGREFFRKANEREREMKKLKKKEKKMPIKNTRTLTSSALVECAYRPVVFLDYNGLYRYISLFISLSHSFSHRISFERRAKGCPK